MKSIETYDHLKNVIKNNNFLLIYASMPQCSVCKSDFPKVEKLVEDLDFPAYNLDLSHLPEAAGQLSLMTAPIVLLFYQSREWHRQARILDFEELEFRMKELKYNA